MNIFINARFLTQNTTGVQRFATELCKALLNYRENVIFLVPDLNSVINRDLLKLFNIREVKGGRGHYWEQITLPKYLRELDSPLLINLCNTAPIAYSNKMTMVHDIVFIHYPQSFTWKFKFFYNLLIPLVLKTSKKILSGTRFAANDICENYKFYNSKISIINSAVSDEFKPDVVDGVVDKPYALAVSSPTFHKNFTKMINAFLESNVSLDLKIIGSLAGSFNKQSKDIAQDSRIQFMGRVTDDELLKLYQQAEFFIFPSLYEGFGIPPLEAQACGCPVISSNVASLPEVLGNSAFYFDPHQVNNIKKAIEKISKDPVLRQELIQKGLENVKRFSWDKSASKLHGIINEILNSEI